MNLDRLHVWSEKWLPEFSQPQKVHSYEERK